MLCFNFPLADGSIFSPISFVNCYSSVLLGSPVLIVSLSFEQFLEEHEMIDDLVLALITVWMSLDI